MQKDKTDVKHLDDILKELPADDLRTALTSLVFLGCPPTDQIRVDRCTGQCTQVKRLIEGEIEFLGNIIETGTCGADKRVIAESIVRGEGWEYNWTDDQKCSGNCRCTGKGDGKEVDRFTVTRPYDETLKRCRLVFTARFTVVKFRRPGECRPT